MRQILILKQMLSKALHAVLLFCVVRPTYLLAVLSHATIDYFLRARNGQTNYALIHQTLWALGPAAKGK